MPASYGNSKSGRILLAACLGIAGLAAASGSALAQQHGQREILQTPTEKNFLNPGTVSPDQRGPGYVVDGLISSPPYGPTDRYGRGSLPPAIGSGGDPLIRPRN